MEKGLRGLWFHCWLYHLFSWYLQITYSTFVFKFCQFSREILALISSGSWSLCFEICQSATKSGIWESQNAEVCCLVASSSYLSLDPLHCCWAEECLPRVSQASVSYPLYQQEKLRATWRWWRFVVLVLLCSGRGSPRGGWLCIMVLRLRDGSARRDGHLSTCTLLLSSKPLHSWNMLLVKWYLA